MTLSDRTIDRIFDRHNMRLYVALLALTILAIALCSAYSTATHRPPRTIIHTRTITPIHLPTYLDLEPPCPAEDSCNLDFHHGKWIITPTPH